MNKNVKFKIEIPWGIPSKKNRYKIRFNPILWKLIKANIEELKKKNVKKLYWIAPDKEVKRFEMNAAWTIKAELKNFFKENDNNTLFNSDVEVRVIVFVNNMLKDTDNILGALGDSLEKGIPNFNDRQIRKWIIEKRKDSKERILIEILPF